MGMVLEDDEGKQAEHDSFRTYEYPYDYVFLTIEHLVMDKEYQLRYVDQGIGRIIAHIEGLGIIGSGVRGILDASVSRTGEGTWVWVHMNYYTPIDNPWMDDWREEFMDQLDDRISSNYTGDLAGDVGTAALRVPDAWSKVTDFEREVWHDFPKRSRAVAYCYGCGLVMIGIPVILAHLGIYDGYPNWYVLSFLSFPPFVAGFLVHIGRLEQGEVVLGWVGFGFYFVFGIATLLIGWLVLRFPLGYAASLISETQRWEDIRRSVEERKKHGEPEFVPVCSRSNKRRRRKSHKGPAS